MILARDASFPAGGPKRSGNALLVRAPFDFPGSWDFEGLEVSLDATVTLDRPRFHNAVNAHFLHIGEGGTSPTVTLNMADLDCSDLRGDLGESAVQIGSGTLNTVLGNWHDGSRDYVTKFGGRWSATGDRFTLAGLTMDRTSHEDGVIHDNGGELLFDGCFIDFRRHGHAPLEAGWTGVMYAQARNSPISWKIRNTPILGAADLGLLAPIQSNPRQFSISIDMRSCPVEPGPKGRIIIDTPVVGHKTTITGAFNTNALTLKALPL